MYVKIYRVSADDGAGGERQLGIAQGDKADINKYYEAYKPYHESELCLRELEVKVITPDMANTTSMLHAEKEALESRLKQINSTLQK